MNVRPFLRLLPGLAAALALSSCDDSSTSNDCGPSSTGSAIGCSTIEPAGHPPILVGSWVARPNEYSVAHMVLQPDGTGKAIGESGTRRDVSDISWSADDSTLLLTRPGIPDSRTYWSVRHDSLWILTQYVYGRDTTAIFVREPQPSLTASPGILDPRMVGAWKGLSPTVYDSYENNVLVGHDTAWEPETFSFRADGTGMYVTFVERSVEDTTTGDWSYSWTPDDTTRFTWWIGGDYLYTSIWNPAANPPSASNTIGTQVARWGFEGDSLLITKLWGTEIAKRFGRQP
jgi:hypothetical protein